MEPDRQFTGTMNGLADAAAAAAAAAADSDEHTSDGLLSLSLLMGAAVAANSTANATGIIGGYNHTGVGPMNGTWAVGAPVLSGFISWLSVQCMFGLVYGIIFCIGVTGNLLVCFVVCRNRAMHTVTNFFIANLAVSDILMCLLAVPFTPLYTFIGRWVFGAAMCHVVSGAQAVSVYISSLTLTAIALDRYIVIMFPFRERMRVTTCVCLIGLCWLIALVLAGPYMLFVKMDADAETGHMYCEENWPDEEVMRRVFGTATFGLQFIVPFLIISFCYVRVSCRLSSRARSKPGTKSAKKEEADRERKKRTNRMLMAMVAVFGVSWLPMNVVNIVSDYVELNNSSMMITFFLTHCLAMSSTCYNPFLYAWLNENFRKEFKQIMPCLWRLAGGRGGANGAGVGGRGGYNGFRADQLNNSQADGQSMTRASEIIPRGPTCGSSIKKVLRSSLEVAAVAELKGAMSFGEPTMTTTVVNGGDGLLGGTTTKALMVGDLLETQFDGECGGVSAT